MGLTLTLRDTDIPASPAFIEFLHAFYNADAFHTGNWFSQVEEGLSSNEGRFDNIQEKVSYVVAHEEGKKRVLQAYRYFKEMLTGNLDTLKAIARYRFFFIIGIPRTGGTYLTKQLFRGSGIDYTQVQNALAHDGFPHLGALAFKDHGNIHTTGLLQLAEYLVMVDVFFSEHGRLAYKGGVVVPKKFTKGVYNFPLIQEVFGTNAEYIITLRHPLAMVQSVLDKSGGMPEDGKFAVRSAIERWALDDWMRWRFERSAVKEMPYLDVLLGYWKRYHLQLAMEAIPIMPTTRLVPFGAELMEAAMTDLYGKFGITMEPEPFSTSPKPEFDNQAQFAADQVIGEVSDFWRVLDVEFPADALSDMA